MQKNAKSCKKLQHVAKHDIGIEWQKLEKVKKKPAKKCQELPKVANCF